MNVRLLYFAAVRDLVKVDEETIKIEKGSTISSVSLAIENKYPALRGLMSGVRFARNETFVKEDAHVEENDAIAVIPPVAGG